MDEMAIGWKRVLDAFELWIQYEGNEFMPWTGYFNMENLRDLTSKERVAWMDNMVDEIIPTRVGKCQEAGVALEDFLPYMPGPDELEIVRSMIELNGRIYEAILRMSDTISLMLEVHKSLGFEEIAHYLKMLAESEEDIRHHMSLYSQGFGKLQSLGLVIPDEMLG